mmetsp:Transcript_33998/g.108081  ORF Transcript_33998/g.108081 Transcript_33998/m.108081 type:complete len:261 (+) Transcript_33998:332-1114(+)
MQVVHVVEPPVAWAESRQLWPDLVDVRQVGGAQLRLADLEVLSEAAECLGLHHGRGVAAEVPVEADLSGGHPVLLRHPLHDLVVDRTEADVLRCQLATERRVALEGDVLLLAPVPKALVGPMGMRLGLHHVRLHLAPLEEALQVVHREVAETDGARLALLVELLKGLPGPLLLCRVPSRRLPPLHHAPSLLLRVPDKGPLQQQEVHIVHPQLIQLPREGPLRPLVAVVPRRQLGHDEGLAPRHTALQPGPGNVQEVAVHL